MSQLNISFVATLNENSIIIIKLLYCKRETYPSLCVYKFQLLNVGSGCTSKI